MPSLEQRPRRGPGVPLMVIPCVELRRTHRTSAKAKRRKMAAKGVAAPWAAKGRPRCERYAEERKVLRGEEGRVLKDGGMGRVLATRPKGRVACLAFVVLLLLASSKGRTDYMSRIAANWRLSGNVSEGDAQRKHT